MRDKSSRRTPNQASLRRIAEFGVQPRHDLGQNFLIDSNILEVIGRGADLDRGDVVLEVGGGVGVLSEYLAKNCRYLHVVELDQSLERPLRAALDSYSNTSIQIADALDLNLASLDPLPNKVVANLPYNIAATFVLKTLQDLPELKQWMVMVQREVGERFAASAGSRAYGQTSVFSQLVCDVKISHKVSRNVFFPVPNVDSVLLRLVRRSPPLEDTVLAVIRAGFAHRRKTLVRSWILVFGERLGARTELQGLLDCHDLSSDVRAEQLTPRQWGEVAADLARRL